MVRIRWVSFQGLSQSSEPREHQEGSLGAGQAPLVNQHLLPLVEPQCLGLRRRPPGGIFVGELKSLAEMSNLRTCLPFHWWDFSTTQALPRAVIKNKQITATNPDIGDLCILYKLFKASHEKLKNHPRKFSG